MGLQGIRKGKKPRTGPMDTIEAEVSSPMVVVRRRMKQMLTNLGFNILAERLFWDGVSEEL